LDRGEIHQLATNAIRASFLGEAEKQTLLDQVAALDHR
jgi:adenosine deaminase